MWPRFVAAVRKLFVVIMSYYRGSSMLTMTTYLWGHSDRPSTTVPSRHGQLRIWKRSVQKTAFKEIYRPDDFKTRILSAGGKLAPLRSDTS